MAVEYPVHYYEPNDLEYNPEDLNIGIYFEVDIQKRGSFRTGTYKGQASFGFKPVNIFGGEDNLITTSYSDVTILELSNGGDTESIGIESINIKYDSWYFPEVNIKFVDVRGNAVFNPMEMTNDPQNEAQGSFLSCLFMFPYPIFKLTFKGYYGKPVTFKMTVKDMRANLNSQTGNFEISVNFIGYMYNYLTDIPMRLLFAAPYINYDGTTSGLGNFKGDSKEDTTPIPTFIEFISQMAEGLKSMNENEEMSFQRETIDKCRVIKNHVETFKTTYNNIRDLLIKNCIIYSSNGVKVSEVEQFFSNDNGDSFKIVYKHSKEGYDLSTFVTHLNGFIDTIKKNWKQVEGWGNMGDIKTIQNPMFFETDNNNNNDENNCFLSTQGEYLKVDFHMNYNNDMKILTAMLDKANTLGGEMAKKQEETEKEIYRNTINWQPTIKNMFQMTLAHLEILYKNFSKCISNIDNSSSDRQLSDLSVETDCNSHGSEITVYPFPAFYDNQNRYMWIGNVPEARHYHERNFVEYLLEGIMSARDKMETEINNYEQTFNTIYTFPQKGVPSLFYDIEFGNPYAYLDFENLVTVPKDDEDGLPLSAKIFVTRYLLKYFYNFDNRRNKQNKKDEDIKVPYLDDLTFARIEAINLLGEGNNIKAVRDSGFWGEDVFNGDKIWKYAKKIAIEKYAEKIDDGVVPVPDEHYHAYPITDKKSDIYVVARDYQSGDVNGEPLIDHFYHNTVRSISTSEYDDIMAGAYRVILDEGIDSDIYGKAFPASSSSIKPTYKGINLNERSKACGFIQTTMKSYLNKTEGAEYDEVIKRLKASLPDGEDRLYPSLSTYFDVRLNSKDVVDFYPYFNEENDRTYFNLTKNSLDEIYEPIKETKFGKFFNSEKKLQYSFSCKRYPVYGDKLGDAEDDIKLQILDDFFKSIGFVNINTEEIDEVERSGITCIPLLNMVFWGRYIDKGGFAIQNREYYPILKEALKIYESNWRNISDMLIRYVLSETTANESKERGVTDYVSVQDSRKCYVFRRLSDTAIEELNKLFNSKCYIFNLHGCFRYLIRDFEKGYASNAIEEMHTNLTRAFVNFQKEVAIKCGLNLPEKVVEEVPQVKDTAVSDDRKLGIYDTLKNLYDRWKFGCNETYKINENTETQVSIDNFVFRNALNEDIGDKYNVNIEKIVNLIGSIFKGDAEMSVYTFLTEIARISDCMMLALPVNVFEVMNSMDKMKELFTPYRYISAKDEASQTTYIITHRQKTSQHLKFGPNTSEYKDDSVDFKNKVCQSVDGGDEQLGVFGVTYSLGAQHFFKDIRVGMDKPVNTEQSIAATMQIAETGGSKGSNVIGRGYHDLFDTYSSHSYNCTVTMMGNAQIMPMMYFQLNNVGMFKGGYMIINVEHTINNQGMTTTFIGNRLSKYQFNLATDNVWERNGIDNTEYGGSSRKNSKGNTSSAMLISERTKDVDSSLVYSKKNTVIVIDAGHDRTISGKESPDLNNEEGMFSMDNPERRGDGVLNPKTTDNQETYRYREYWGNRKIASKLVEKLERGGYNVKPMYNDGKDAKNYDNFGGKVNDLYEDLKNEGKTMIIVSIHSNAAANSGWGGGNFWCIYKQRNDIIGVYNPNTSHELAKCIAKKANEIFNDPKNINSLPVVNGKRMEVKIDPQVFADEPGKVYRPTTLSHAPSVLSENLFHDTKEHVKFLATQKGRDMIAEIHYQGIIAFFEKMQIS